MSMSNLPNETIREQAARWVELVTGGTISGAEHQMLTRWLVRDPQHEREYRAHLAIAMLARELSADIGSTTQPRAETSSNVITLTPPVSSPLPQPYPIPRYRRWFPGIAVAAGLILLASAWVTLSTIGLIGGTHSTEVGEFKTIVFEDGSTARLNTKTRLKWEGNDHERKVVLIAGEAFFDVVPHATRPFSVMVDRSEVRVLGTSFNVYRKNNGQVIVSVVEGSVEVRDASSQQPSWSKKLGPAQQITYTSLGLTRGGVEPIVGRVATWREGLLSFPFTPIEDVVDEMSRYTNQRIIIKDPRIAQLGFGGALSARDTRAALARLERLTPEIVVTENDGAFTLDYRSDAR